MGDVNRTSDLVRIDIIDVPWLMQIARDLSDKYGRPVRPHFKTAVSSLSAVRKNGGLLDSQGTFAALSVDLRRWNDGTSGLYDFRELLRKAGIIPLPFDYRFGGPSLAKSTDLDVPNLQQFTSIIGYLIGLAAGRSNSSQPAEIVLLSGSFDFYYPLCDLIERRNGRAVLACPEGHLDGRWVKYARILTGECPIKYQKLPEEEWLGAGDTNSHPDEHGVEGLDRF